MTQVLFFDDYSKQTVQQLGGKGFNLCRLRAAGLNVPDGFCVTVDAFDAMLQSNQHLNEVVAAWLDGKADTQAVNAAWAAADFPTDLALQINQSVAKLDSADALAVRSSAIVEDSAKHSFAGQFDTKLGITGTSAVHAALRKCWASLFNETLRQHLKDHSLDRNDLKMAVVIQTMIQPRAAGVMFTVDPLSQNPSHLRVEANYGLGETLVSGDITPDSIVIDKASGQMIDQQIASKADRLEFRGGRLTTVAVDTDEQDQLCLRAGDIKALVSTAEQIENWAGCPQDIEWAFDGAQLHIVQSRDITTLDDMDSALFTPQVIEGTWTRENMDERYEDVATPLTISTVYAGLEKGLEATFNRIGIFTDGKLGPIIRVFYGRPYLNKTLAVHALKGIKVDNTQMESVLGDRGRIGFNPRLPIIGIGVVRMISKSATEWAKFRAENLDDWQALTTKELAPLNIEELHLRLNEQTSLMDQYWVLHMLNVRSADFCQKILQALLEQVYPSKEAAFEVFCRLSAGFTESITYESDSAIYRLSRQILRDPMRATLLRQDDLGPFLASLSNDAEGESIRAAFEQLLQRFGNKMSSQELADAQWRDDPQTVWRHIAGAMDKTDIDPKERILSKVADREEAFSEALAQFSGILSRPMRPFFKWAYRHMCAYIPSRENDQFQLGKMFFNTRQILRALGARLVNAGVIEEADDIYMLEQSKIPASDEAMQAADLTDYVASQKVRRETFRAMSIPFAINDDGTASPKQAVSDSAMSGAAVSQGAVVGTAKLALHPSELDTLENGQILVTHSTNPAWTPAFARLGGLVTEAGGLLSHGAIMAREYGIPAVLGVRGITNAIKSGDTIEVNGTLGHVTPHIKDEAKASLSVAAE